MIEYKDLSNTGFEVIQQGNMLHVKRRKFIVGKHQVVPFSDYYGIEIKYESVPSKAGEGEWKTGFTLWLMHHDPRRCAPIYSSRQSPSISNYTLHDARLDARAKAEEYSNQFKIPILMDESKTFAREVEAKDNNITFKNRVDKERLEKHELVVPKMKYLWVKKDFQDIIVSRNLFIPALIRASIFMLLGAVIYFILPEHLWTLSLVIYLMGVIVLVMGSSVEKVVLKPGGFDYESRKFLGLVRDDRQILFQHLEVIQVDQNPGLGGNKGICFVSDLQLFYFGTGYKDENLKELLVFFTWSVVDHQRVDSLLD